MRIFVIILAISSFLAKDIASFTWDVWFYVNQKEITRDKCENKAKPAMNCHGKCYLAKQLKKLEQKEQNHNNKTNPFRNIEKVQFFSNNNFIALQFNPINQLKKQNYFYTEFFSKEKISEIFHPPTI